MFVDIFETKTDYERPSCFAKESSRKWVGFSPNKLDQSIGLDSKKMKPEKILLKAFVLGELDVTSRTSEFSNEVKRLKFSNQFFRTFDFSNSNFEWINRFHLMTSV